MNFSNSLVTTEGGKVFEFGRDDAGKKTSGLKNFFGDLIPLLLCVIDVLTVILW